MKNKSKKRGTFLATLFLKKNRRGSHVGMIISFAVFITFVVFLYTVIRPAVNVGANEKATLDYLKTKITENISSNFTTAGVQIDSDENPHQNCVTLENFFVLLSEQIPPPYRVIVKNETGSIQPSYLIALDSGNLLINRNNRNNLFFKVYSAPEFNGLAVNISVHCSSSIQYYTISSVTVNNYIFEKDVYAFMNYYNNSYNQLKIDLKVPEANEFGFDFTAGNGTKLSIGESSGVSGGVYAEEIPIQYIDNNANIQSGFINIRLW